MATLTLNPTRLARSRMGMARPATLAWLVALTAVLALHFVHLRADFPNHSQWMDWAKYTDEGWYANAAIRHQLTGSWYRPGDFNPAVALPVWHLLAAGLFKLTGVSIVALRTLTLVVFLADLGLMYLLLRATERPSLALLGVTVAATSAFLSVFDRMAILEPMVVCWFLLGLWLARRAAGARRPRPRLGYSIALGVVLCLMVLTKTTGVFLIPALFCMLWSARQDWRPEQGLRRFAQTAGAALGTGLLLFGIYYMQCIRPHYLVDYQYLFSVNDWPRPRSLAGWLWDTRCTLRGLFWIGRILPWVAGAICLLTLRPLRGLWRNPLFPASLLAIAGVLFFVWWHNNTQPRYYVLAAAPVIFVATLGTAALLRASRLHMAGMGALGLLVLACLVGTWRIAITAAYPQYTYLQAAQSLAHYIDQHPGRNRTVLSVSSDDLSLLTGLPTICDDFGSDTLDTRIARYQPGWFAAWNHVDKGTLEDIHSMYRLVRVAAFPALDDSDRNELVLYRMDPLPGPDVGVVVDDTP